MLPYKSLNRDELDIADNMKDVVLSDGGKAKIRAFRVHDVGMVEDLR